MVRKTFMEKSFISIIMVSLSISIGYAQTLQIVNDEGALLQRADYKSNMSKTSSFKIISHNKRLPKLIAFSDDAIFEENAMPENVKSWLDSYCDMARLFETDTLAAKRWHAAHAPHFDDIPPLLGDIEWGQERPFNTYCPKVNGRTCPSGCVATALAQIMFFHRWPECGVGTKSYTTKTHEFEIFYDFDQQPFDWDNMLPNYSKAQYSLSMGNAVGALLQAVGAAVDMDYDASGSGTNNKNAAAGMSTYLRYDNDLVLADPNAFTDASWHYFLQTELAEGRPVYYSGSDNESGHAFVIDGMRTGDNGLAYYHVNWGWNGLCNGYYLLDVLRPSEAGTGGTTGSNYSHNPSMIARLIPEDGIQTPLFGTRGFDTPASSFFPSQGFDAVVENLSLLTNTKIEGTFSISLSDPASGQSYGPLFEADERTFLPFCSIERYSIQCIIPENTPAGEYRLLLEVADANGQKHSVIDSGDKNIVVHDLQDWTCGSGTSPRQCIAYDYGVMKRDDSDYSTLHLAMNEITAPFDDRAIGEAAILLCDKTGRFIRALSAPQTIVILSGMKGQNRTIYGRADDTVPDGSYLVTVGYRESSDDDWTLAYRRSKEDENGLPTYSTQMYSVTVRAGQFALYGKDTSITFPSTDSNNTFDWYTTQGTRLSSDPLSGGIYIRQTGTSSSKHFVK